MACLLVSSLAHALTPCYTDAIDETKVPPPGQMIDVGGYRLHLYSSGSGSPTVILECGLGGISTDWALVQDEIAKFTRVISYDRAGIGWSESGPLPRASQQIVQELHTLLAKANIPGPYILVGHSLGGNNVQLYATTYPEDVLGLVLVDSTHEEQESKLPPHPLDDALALMQTPQDLWFKSNFGPICFETQTYLNSKLALLPKNMQRTRSAICTTKRHLHTISLEADSFLESLKELAGADRSCIRNKPCFILTMGRPTDLSKFGVTDNNELQKATEKLVVWQNKWNELQKDLTSQYNHSHQLIAEKSDHAILWHQPELIVQAVKDLIGKNTSTKIGAS